MNNELTHHGVKGQRWGVITKTYQRVTSRKSKGSSTESTASTAKKKRFSLIKKKTAKVQKTLTEEQVNRKKQAVIKSRSAKQLYENAHLFDDRELSSAYNRLVLERNIKSLTPKEVNKGDQFINKINKAAKFVESGSKLYNNCAKVYNATQQGQSKPLPIVGAKKDDKKDDDKKDKK